MFTLKLFFIILLIHFLLKTNECKEFHVMLARSPAWALLGFCLRGISEPSICPPSLPTTQSKKGQRPGKHQSAFGDQTKKEQIKQIRFCDFLSVATPSYDLDQGFVSALWAEEENSGAFFVKNRLQIRKSHRWQRQCHNNDCIPEEWCVRRWGLTMKWPQETWLGSFADQDPPYRSSRCQGVPLSAPSVSPYSVHMSVIRSTQHCFNAH